MKLPEIKDLLYTKKKCVKTTILSVIIASSLTGCSFAFEKSDKSYVDTVLSNDTTQDFITEVSTAINDVDDWNSKDDLEELSNKIIEAANIEVKEEPTLENFQKASIVRVVDGDTIIVDIMADNCGNKDHEMKVRLIGVDTPESVASEEYLERTGKENTEEGKEASIFTKTILENVDYVYLQTDTSDTDRYGRLLRYVWIDTPTNEWDLEEISTKMLQGILLTEKVAEPVRYEPDTMYAEQFDEIYDER